MFGGSYFGGGYFAGVLEVELPPPSRRRGVGGSGLPPGWTARALEAQEQERKRRRRALDDELAELLDLDLL